MRKVGIARTAAARNAGAPGSENMIDITDENLATTASVLGGMVGLLCGGAGLGVALFAGTAYFAREEDSDVSNIINGVARKGLETVNLPDTSMGNTTSPIQLAGSVGGFEECERCAGI